MRQRCSQASAGEEQRCRGGRSRVPRHHHITDTHPFVHLSGQSPCFFHLLPQFSEMWCSSHHCSWLFNSSHWKCLQWWNRRKLSMEFFFSFIFISWKLITLQYCSGFCHTLTWISHGSTCVPVPIPPPASLPIPSLWVFFKQKWQYSLNPGGKLS